MSIWDWSVDRCDGSRLDVEDTSGRQVLERGARPKTRAQTLATRMHVPVCAVSSKACAYMSAHHVHACLRLVHVSMHMSIHMSAHMSASQREAEGFRARSLGPTTRLAC